MSFRRWTLVFAMAGLTVVSLSGQETGQPASDVLLQFDPWGNPTPRGGVTNNGPNAHSVW
ncbi:MAG TPA: hypothetical protein EYN90_06495 [Acidobacteria bacterium]|jgi:hypothetical protein|nr:hypothetical protein [Acidobacteriota bacterium]